ncbi:hypothetical protein CHS0354_006925 [Potamilus streckersoni]|uniref:ABC transporter domain-containing protein n=1 Tax=Potamilus streckersoni TaxID=2493646 RepID=A0AAE0TF78_9BIVA|nr:hypothetical protein CHS0354_006925 [Potamilus streckersoni]
MPAVRFITILLRFYFRRGVGLRKVSPRSCSPRFCIYPPVPDFGQIARGVSGKRRQSSGTYARRLAYTLGGQTLFKNLNLTLDHGMTAGVIGPSGVGKTSLLYLIAGLAKPSTGTIRADDEILTGEGIFVPPEKTAHRMVFQDYAVFPHMTVEKNLLFGMKFIPRHEHRPRLNEMLEVMRLTNLRGRYPHELSGGQQQRVAIARTPT